MFDYAVIGAGIAGASVAYRLSGSGARVILLEQEPQPGYHATGRSAAMYLETYGSEHTRALTRASRNFYLSPPDGFTKRPILETRGVLHIARNSQESLLDAAYAAYYEQGIEVSRLSPEQAASTVPCLIPNQLAGAILDPMASDMDVNELHQGFLRASRAGGAELLCNAKVEAAAYTSNVWTLNTTANCKIQARVIVNAAGAWADRIACLCDAAPLGIQPFRRSVFSFDPPPDMDTRQWPMVMSVDEEFYFKPDAGMLLGSPANADPVNAQDVMPEELDIATGISRIEEATSLRIQRPKHTWAGLRSFAKDHELVIGWDAQVPAFFWLAGQGGYGIHTAAGASLLASALLQNKPIPRELVDCGVSAEIVNPARLNVTKPA